MNQGNITEPPLELTETGEPSTTDPADRLLWLDTIHQDFGVRLKRLECQGTIDLDRDVLSLLVALQDSNNSHRLLLETLLQALDLHRPQSVALSMESTAPATALDHGYPLPEHELAPLVQIIYTKLHSIPSVRRVSLRSMSASLVVSLWQCPIRHVTSWEICNNDQLVAQEATATILDMVDLAACIKAHSWLEELSLMGYSKIDLAALGPSIATLGQLTTLRLSGHPGRPWMIESQADANTLTRLFTMPSSLKELELDHVQFATALAAMAFGQGLAHTTALEKLRISGGVRFPSDSHASVARALIKPKLVELVFAAPASLEFLIVFRQALMESETSVLERLSFQTSPNVLAFFCLEQIGDRPLYRRLDPAWIAPVQRTLRLNGQRRTSPALFAAIQHAATETDRRVRMLEAVDGVDMPIVYEFFCRNENNLRNMIKDALHEVGG